jgi:Bacterial regulatory protein, arsR family/Low molecular weight phosphotyrosine protein phosphatase
LRWRIVALLAAEQLGVAHLTEELGVGQPLVSHHLKVLRTAGLVTTDRYRYWTYYRLHPDALRLLATHLDGLTRTSADGPACRRAVDGQTPTASSSRPAIPRGGRLMPPDGAAMDPVSRQRLRALAQAEGAIVKEVPEVLFVCVHNAGRSQMAAALLDHHAKGRVHVRSAGSDPGDMINPAVVAAMDDPAGQPVEVVRGIRDQIDARVQALLAELVPAGT